MPRHSLKPYALCSLQEAKDYIPAQTLEDVDADRVVTRLINSVSEDIFDYTGGREFLLLSGENPQTRTIELLSDGDRLAVGDMSDFVSITVDGITIDSAGITTRPLRRKPWDPNRELRLDRSYLAGVEFAVTGSFGFPSLPESIRQVCIENVRERFLEDVARESEQFADEQTGRPRRRGRFLASSYETLDDFREGSKGRFRRLGMLQLSR
jgi:hypothetical protein